MGGASIRLDAMTNVTLLNLDDRIAQVQLVQGSISLHVRRLEPRQSFEIDTPNLAFTLHQPGDYRIDVDADGSATSVRIRSGRGEVYGEGESYTVDPQRGYRFYGTDLSDYETLVAHPDDDFDRWARARDRREDNSPSARYVSPDVVGYQDLDSNGTWRSDPSYGNVWTPNRVAAGWAPYRDGHWAWVDPWGWTWVDDAPWGFAVSHYGRWANISGTWGWVPGPVREQAVYAPALVAFVGGNNFRVTLSVGGAVAAAVGWFPLAPREVYQPPYPVSRGYFDNVNRSNAVIAPAVITNVYNTTVVNNSTTIVGNTTNVTKVVYVNQQVAGAVVAVPAQTFVQSQPVARAAVPVSVAAAVRASVVAVAAVIPVQQSVHGGAPEAGVRPPRGERAVVARTEPPPPPIAFVAQQQQLATKPGAPIDENQRKRLLPAAPAVTAPRVNVMTTVRAPVPTALPPAAPPAGKKPETRNAEAAPAVRRSEDALKAGAAKLEAAKAEAAKADAAKADAGKAEAARSAQANAEAIRAEAAKAEAAKVDTHRKDITKAEAARSGHAEAEALKAEAERSASAKVDASKADVARDDAAKAEATRAANARAAASKVDAAKADSSRVEAAKADTARSANARAEASKVETAKIEAAREAAAKSDAARVASARAEVERAAKAHAEAAKAEPARAEAQRGAMDKAEATRSETARDKAAMTEAARAASAKAEAERAKAARDGAAKAAAAKAAVAPPPAPVAQSPQVRPSLAELPPAKPHPPGSKPETEEDRKKKEDEARHR